LEHIEVGDEEYARQRLADVFQLGWARKKALKPLFI